MKVRMIQLWFIVLAASVLALSAYAIDKKSVLVYYPCDEGSGEDVKDASGNDRHAEWRKGVTKRDVGKWTVGKFGKALDFEEAGNYCVAYETKKDPELDEAAGSEPFTVSYWVQTTSKAGKGRTVDKGSHGCNKGWHSAVNGEKIIFEASDGGGCIHHWDEAVSDGKWHHVAHSIIPAKTVKTYIDGVQNLGDFAAMAAKKSISSEDGRPLALGVSFEFNTEFLNAQLDDIAIFNYAMSKDEINELGKGPLKEILAVESMGKLTTTWGAIKMVPSTAK